MVRRIWLKYYNFLCVSKGSTRIMSSITINNYAYENPEI